MIKTAIITGASSGLGKEIEKKMHWCDTIDWSLATGVDVSKWRSVKAAEIDLVQRGVKQVDCLINCAGVNHLDYIPDLEESDWDRVMNTNAKGIYLCTQAALPLMPRGSTILNIVSNASHVPMTSSLAYNASKGAAEIMTKQMARELGKTHGITVFGISPNKLKNTGMSAYIEKRVCEIRGWTKEQAEQYQLAALPAGEETDPETLAEFIAFLLSSKQRHKFLAGTVIPYGGP